MMGEFEAELRPRTLERVRLTCWLGISLFLLFALLDLAVYPDLAGRFFVLRLICAAGHLALLVMTYRPWALRSAIALGMGAYLWIAGFIIEMLRETGGHSSPYYAGLMLVLLGMGVLMPWRPLPSILTAAGICCGWAIFAGRGQNSPIVWHAAINNGFFLFGGAVIAVAAGAFSHRMLLQELGARATLSEANHRLAEAKAQAEALATTDGLTGLPNHRRFQEQLAIEIARNSRSQLPLSLLMIDVDHFKRLNDQHGHPAGDEALRGVATNLRTGRRKTDLVARYGGEEFAILLSDTSKAAATAVAERICAEVRAQGVVTISIGVASCPSDANDPATLVAKADEALYAAKRHGRDRVVCFTDPNLRDTAL